LDWKSKIELIKKRNFTSLQTEFNAFL